MYEIECNVYRWEHAYSIYCSSKVHTFPSFIYFSILWFKTFFLQQEARLRLCIIKAILNFCYENTSMMEIIIILCYDSVKIRTLLCLLLRKSIKRNRAKSSTFINHGNVEARTQKPLFPREKDNESMDSVFESPQFQWKNSSC